MNHGAPLGNVLDLAGAIVLVALGVWSLWLRPRRRTNLLLAAFALTMGTGFLLVNAWIIATAITPGNKVGMGFFFPVVTVLFYAATVFLVLVSLRLPRPLAASERRLLALPTVVVGGLWAFVIAFSWSVDPWLLAGWPTAEVLLVVAFGFPLLLMPHRAMRWIDDPDAAPLHRQAVLVAAALTLFGGLRYGMFALSLEGPTWVFSIVPVVAAVLWLHVLRGRAAANRSATSARNMVLLSLGMPLVGMGLFAVVGQPLFNSGLSGLVRTVTVLVLAYAILQHQLLGIDVKVRWTISKTTVAGVFVAVFFIVSEGAQVLFADFAGSELIGILAAGALLFALSPIQELADRLAEKAVPGDGDAGDADAEETYRVALSKFLADGEVTNQEERHLARMADRLGIGAERAFEMREEAEQDVGEDGSGKVGS